MPPRHQSSKLFDYLRRKHEPRWHAEPTMRHLTSTHARSRRARAISAPAEIGLIDIYRSFGPFVCLQLLVLMLVLFFPWLATALL
jgi:hypothetical protein